MLVLVFLTVLIVIMIMVIINMIIIIIGIVIVILNINHYGCYHHCFIRFVVVLFLG